MVRPALPSAPRKPSQCHFLWGMWFSRFKRNCRAKTLGALFFKVIDHSYSVYWCLPSYKNTSSVSKWRNLFFSPKVCDSTYFLDRWLYDCFVRSSAAYQKNSYDRDRILPQGSSQICLVVGADDKRIYKFDLKLVISRGVKIVKQII
jgi:hypothetical protein